MSVLKDLIWSIAVMLAGAVAVFGIEKLESFFR